MCIKGRCQKLCSTPCGHALRNEKNQFTSLTISNIKQSELPKLDDKIEFVINHEDELR